MAYFLDICLTKKDFTNICAKTYNIFPAFLSVNAAVPVFKNQMCDNVE